MLLPQLSKKKLLTLSTTLIWVVMLSACVSTPIGSESEVTELRQEIQTLRNEVAQLQTVIKGLQAQQGRQEVAPEQVNFDNNPTLGNKQATVAIIEFSDYECPFCRRFHGATFDLLKKRYIDTGKVRYVYRDFPLSFHRNAKSAAVAANCAGKQGAYWAMQRKLFGNNQPLNQATYLFQAEAIKLRMKPFKACMQDPKIAEEVESDFAAGQALGVNGTPAFFIGKVEGDQIVAVRRITGAQPYATVLLHRRW